MPTIHIARNGQSLGVFSEDQIREGIGNGQFAATDLFWREGAPDWRPLGELASPWGVEILLTPPVPSSANNSDVVGTPVGGDGCEPAWERRKEIGFFPAIFKTIKGVLFQPSTTFANLKQTGGIFEPLFYYLALVIVAGAIPGLYDIAIQRAGWSPFGQVGLLPFFPHGIKPTPAPLPSFGLLGMLKSTVIFLSTLVISPFLTSGMTHLALKLVGGAKRPFETTFRVNCYAQSVSVLNFLPFGVLLAIPWGIYCNIVGLKEAQGIEWWRATLAFLLLPLLCCCMPLSLLLLFGAHHYYSLIQHH